MKYTTVGSSSWGESSLCKPTENPPTYDHIINRIILCDKQLGCTQLCSLRYLSGHVLRSISFKQLRQQRPHRPAQPTAPFVPVANATYAELGFTSSGWILTSIKWIKWMFRSTFVQYGRVNFLAARRVAGDGGMSY